MKRAGAINHRSGATLTVTDSLFMNNRAVSVDGGDGATASAINSRSGSSVPVRHCTFLGNEAIAGDGGVVSDSTKLVGFGCGSAIYNNSSTLSVENSTFTNNRAVGGSGGSGEGAMTTVFYTLDVGAGGIAGPPTARLPRSIRLLAVTVTWLPDRDESAMPPPNAVPTSLKSLPPVLPLPPGPPCPRTCSS